MILLALVCAAAGAYQVLALLACIRHLLRRSPSADLQPPISILKPIYGADDNFWPAIVSHARLKYPRFEILFGVANPSDSAISYIQRLKDEYPAVAIQLVNVRTETPNRKVGTLIDLAREARYPVLVVNDSDIIVPKDYLGNLAASLGDDCIGLVTCLYRAGADSFPTKWEALGIATDFAPSAMVAPLVGVREFGLGATLAFRSEDLERIGGFASIADYIADDYQLGKQISRSGKRVSLSRMPVETHLGAGSWKGVWQHQVRWARTIRLSRGAYFGIPITNASLWAVCAAMVGWWHVAVALLTVRGVVGLLAGLAVLQDPITSRYWWLMPFRDLWGFAVWVAGALGSTVIWRGQRMLLDKGGRIVGIRPK